MSLPNDLSRRGFIQAAGLAAATGTLMSSTRRAFATNLNIEVTQPAGNAGPFGYDFPYPSQRMPVFARNCVATSQPLAAQAGLEMLQRGGNAVDAAVATAAALTVVEPGSNGIGSDNFALLWMNGELHGLNASGKSGAALNRDDFEGLDSVPLYGWESVTTPGTVSGWVAAITRFGNLTLEAVLEPAIRYATDGFLISPNVANSFRAGERRYKGASKFDAWRATFLPGGSTPQTGQLFRAPDHARTLRLIGETDGGAFYEGELARAMDAASRAGGGSLRFEDLRTHEAEWVDPLSVDYRGYRLHEIPPNGQGMTALIALGILREFDLKGFDPDAPECLHLQIEAMKLAFRDADRYIADPAFMDIDPNDLLSSAYLRERASLISRSTATDFKHGTPKSGGTVLLTTADAAGNMVSFIQSNYTGFGSGMVVPGTGIAMQNRGGCFVVEKGHPNDIGPSKKPYHTIIPGFVTRGDGASTEPVMSFGVMGGYMQPQGHAQVMSRVFDHRQNPQTALDAPRWQVEEGLEVSIEPGFDEEVYESLSAMGHDLRRRRSKSASFGRGQAIFRLENGYLAASDQRADGQAVGF